MKQQTEPMHPILAKFHEAKEAGFEWADDAIAAFDKRYASRLQFRTAFHMLSYSLALYSGFWWRDNPTRAWEKIWNDLKEQGL